MYFSPTPLILSYLLCRWFSSSSEGFVGSRSHAFIYNDYIMIIILTATASGSCDSVRHVGNPLLNLQLTMIIIIPSVGEE